MHTSGWYTGLHSQHPTEHAEKKASPLTTEEEALLSKYPLKSDYLIGHWRCQPIILKTTIWFVLSESGRNSCFSNFSFGCDFVQIWLFLVHREWSWHGESATILLFGFGIKKKYDTLMVALKEDSEDVRRWCFELALVTSICCSCPVGLTETVWTGP